MNKYLSWQTFMGILLILIVCAVSKKAGSLAVLEEYQARSQSQPPLVVLDPGHGGRDPGKVGAQGELEKDINLEIALKLEKYLEDSDVDVILTREADQGLYEEKDKSKKASDMARRSALINKARPSLTVSIHQNSYEDPSVGGGQVFYYEDSPRGKELAAILQERLNAVTDPFYSRSAKPNESYYLLLHVKSPIVIVECGFLSNPREAKLLENQEYQDQMAFALHMGIMEYLNESATLKEAPS